MNVFIFGFLAGIVLTIGVSLAAQAAGECAARQEYLP